MKNKRDIFHYTILIIIVIGMVVWEIYKPKPVDWTMYLEQEKKDPYGTFALYESLPDLFAGKTVRTDDRSLYEQSEYDFPTEKNLIFLTESFSPTDDEARLLLNYADEGNHIFIATYDLSYFLMSELNLDIKPVFSATDDTVELNFTNKHLKRSKNYKFEKTYNSRYFNFESDESTGFELLEEDSAQYKILSVNSLNNPVYIKRQYGEGAFYIHLHPEMFTNFAMVTQRNEEYAFKCLSYLPDYDVLWDEYYKPNQVTEQSHLKYVLKNAGLRNAYRIALVLLIIYTIFTAKRRQRIIPVITPLKNTTVEFTETVGRLYYHAKNNKNIALKKYNYWTEHLRQHFFVSKDDITATHAERLAEKTGASAETIRHIIRLQENIQKIDQISDKTLSEFSGYIEDYYQQEK